MFIVKMLKGYMLIYRNAERLHGQRKVGKPGLTSHKDFLINNS